ncbi:MAG: hypothetical protein IJS37_03830 [Bacilli bacterium]|nr:hypothetical protein [Bacilli bacterium]
MGNNKNTYLLLLSQRQNRDAYASIVCLLSCTLVCSALIIAYGLTGNAWFFIGSSAPITVFWLLGAAFDAEVIAFERLSLEKSKVPEEDATFSDLRILPRNRKQDYPVALVSNLKTVFYSLSLISLMSAGIALLVSQ